MNIDLYPQYNFSFDNVKQMLDSYDLIKDNEKFISIDKKTGNKISDPLIVSKVKFATLWFQAFCNSVLKSRGPGDYSLQYEYAFSDSAREMYNILSKSFLKQMNIGRINTEVLKMDMRQSVYKYARPVLDSMLETPGRRQVISEYYQGFMSVLAKTDDQSQTLNNFLK